MDTPWIAVDFDGTLAKYEKWNGASHCGDPIPEMVGRVKKWLADGQVVKIFTARVSSDGSRSREIDANIARMALENWSLKHLGKMLEVTCQKDYGMIELWDDRAVAVEHNTGRPLNQSTRGL